MSTNGTAEEELRAALNALKRAERRLGDLEEADAPAAEIEKAQRDVREERAAFQRAVNKLPPA